MISLPKPAFPKNRKFYILLAGNVVILALIGFFVLRPVFSLLVKHTGEITTTKAEIANFDKRTSELRKLKEVYPAYHSVYAPLLDSLPKTRDVAGYQTELEELAKITSIRLISVETPPTGAKSVATTAKTESTASSSEKPGAKSSPTPAPVAAPGGLAATAGGFPVINVNMTVEGSYASVLDFVNRLETMDRFTKLTGLQLTANGATGQINATINVQTLYAGGNV